MYLNAFKTVRFYTKYGKHIMQVKRVIEALFYTLMQ